MQLAFEFDSGVGEDVPAIILPMVKALCDSNGANVEHRFDFVLANPPFTLPAAQQIAALEGEPSQVLKTSGTFVERAVASLRPRGRAAVIVPDGFLFVGGELSRLRRRMIEAGQLEAVVRLPVGLFEPYTGVRVSMLLLRESGKAANVRVIDASSLHKLSRSACGSLDSSAYRFDVIRDSGGAVIDLMYLDVAQSASSPQSCDAWDVSVEELSISGWNLATDRRRGDPRWLQSSLGKALQARGEVTLLGNVSRVLAGRAIRDASLCAGDVPAGSAPYIRIQDVRDGATYAGDKWILPSTISAIDGARRLVAGDLLLSRSGTIGKVGVVHPDLAGGVPSGGLYIVRADGRRLVREFLAAYLRCADCQEWMSSKARGSVIQCLTLAIASSIMVPIPPLPVQGAVAARFRESGVDALTLLAEELGFS